MVFSSLEFLCVFLPVVLILYSIVPGLRVKNALLIISSLAFYAYGEPVYVLLMLGSVLVNYVLAIYVGRLVHNPMLKKAIMVLDIMANLGVLAVFKYADFFIGTINDVCKTDIPLPQITLPIGISFFTFQALSYVLVKTENSFCFQKFLLCKLCTTFPFHIGKLFFCITAFPLIGTADYHFHILLPHSIFISQLCIAPLLCRLLDIEPSPDMMAEIPINMADAISLIP